jgi:sigma-B regulation protein RsbU (phosphoserine phosphatase)
VTTRSDDGPDDAGRPEDLYEDAPCGLLSMRPDGTLVRVNRTFLAWTGHRADDLVGRARFRDLLAVGDRIYYETHYAPLLQMQDEVREIAVTLVCPRGRLPVLVNSVLVRGADGSPRTVRIAVFLAADRRRYEAELLDARRRAEESEARVRLLARTLQTSLMPPELPRIPGLDLAAVYRPAGRGDEVGGDFYDAFQTGPGDWSVVVGDVAGKGAAAAAVTSLVRHTVRTVAMRVRRPRGVLGALNDALRRQGTGGRFCSLAYARVRLGPRDVARVTVSLGGHPAPLVLADDAPPAALGRFGTLLGAVATPDLHDATAELRPGDALVLYTDGVIEARRDGELYGEDRLAALAGELHGQDASALATGIAAAAVDHQRGLPSDDIAVVALRYAGRAV